MQLHIRHETGGDDLESQSDPGQETGEVAGNAGADSQHTSEERADGEEQPNDEEGEHEPRRQEVMLCSTMWMVSAIRYIRIYQSVTYPINS